MAIILQGDNNNNLLEAGSDVDYDIRGLGGADTLIGKGGNDRLNGGTGADSMTGGNGNDTYVVDTAGDTVTEGAGAGSGIDTVEALINHTLAANVENLKLMGTATSGTGNALNNVITGNASNNVLNGLAGADTMQGGLGNDSYFVDNVGDVVIENAGQGTDWLYTSVTKALPKNVENLWLLGTDNINGSGNALANIIQGNSGNNVIDGRLGADTMYGGLGNDTFYVENAADVVSENSAAGVDKVFSNLANYTLGANVENLTLAGLRILTNDSDALVLVSAGVNGTGNALANVIDGNSGANVLRGMAGNDTINGNAGNDYLDGGTGADTMAGGADNDAYVVDNALDVVIEAAAAGTDTVYSSVTHTLSANVENLYLSGSANISGVGNALANHVEGNAGNNTINGGAGADLLVGAAGNDVYVVDNAGDVVRDVESGGGEFPSVGGIDLVRSSVSYTISDTQIENLSLSGVANLNGTGNASNNTIQGNAGNNTLRGLAGNDQLYGYGGNDTLQGGTGADGLRGGAGTDVLRANENVAANDNAEDRFYFDTALDPAANVDLVDLANFSFGLEGTDDEIMLSHFVFTQLRSTAGTTTGSLGAYYFEGAGLTGNGTFDAIGIYNDTTTGQLHYNSTFGTANDSLLFAVVNNAGVPGGSAALSVEEFTLS